MLLIRSNYQLKHFLSLLVYSRTQINFQLRKEGQIISLKVLKRKYEEIEDSNKDKLNAANISIKILMSKINRLEDKIIMYEDTQSVL